MFPDGAIEQYASNIIAQNILNQVDSEGRHYQLFDKIIGHRTDGSESKVKRGCLSTKGHQLHVEWKDGTVEWIPLKDMKESFPVETAEFLIIYMINQHMLGGYPIPSKRELRSSVLSDIEW